MQDPVQGITNSSNSIDFISKGGQKIRLLYGRNIPFPDIFFPNFADKFFTR